MLYDASSNSTQASGCFRVRTSTGAGITLSGESVLKINNITASKDPIASLIVPTYYVNASLLTDINFELKKESGAIITNSVELSDIPTVAFPGNMPTSFSKNNTLIFNCITDFGEVEVLLKGKNIMGEDTSYTQNVTSNPVYIWSNEMSIFQAGTIEICLTRREIDGLANSDQNAGGHINTAYSVHRSFALIN